MPALRDLKALNNSHSSCLDKLALRTTNAPHAGVVEPKRVQPGVGAECGRKMQAGGIFEVGQKEEANS